MLPSTYVLFKYTLEEWQQKVTKINMELKEIVEMRNNKRQSKYKCSFCDKLWVSNVKFNYH